MLETKDILETINMIDNENLDVRTITMGISLLDCLDEDIDRACTKVYDKIMRSAKDLVKTGEDIESEYGIPIINKRISVTPIGMVAAPCQSKNVVRFAHALDKAAKELGVNFIGGYSALVQKGFASGDYALMESIPQALSETDFVCSSVNIGSTKAGINMDAVKMMGKIVKQTAEITADRNCIGAAKLVVFCNAPEDNPFMAGAFHGVGEADTVINVGVSGPRAWVSWSPRKPASGSACPLASLTSPSLPHRLSATAWHIFWRRWAWRSAAVTAPRRRWHCSTTRSKRAA